MKWILPLLTLAILPSCTTKPYMVGSVNDMWYKRHRIPGKVWRQYDYSWQERLYNTAHIPVLYRENVEKQRYPEPIQTYVQEEQVTYSK